MILFLSGPVLPVLHAATQARDKEAVKAGPGLSPGGLNALIRGEPSLVEYWSLDGSTAGAKKKMRLKTVQDGLGFREGPFVGCKSLDLPEGQSISSDVSPVLTSPKITVEMIFIVPGSTERKSGQGCLLGIRNGGDTRFSLHYSTGSYYLNMWDGKGFTAFESDFCFQTNQWYHLAVSMSDTSAVVWVNGKMCRANARPGFVKGTNALPLVVGASDVAGKGDPAGICVSQLAIYNDLLGDRAIVSRIKALGWPDPVELNEVQKVDALARAMHQERKIDFRWKYSPDFIHVHFKNYWKGSQASVSQAKMVLGLYQKMFSVWPEDLTKHIKGVYIFDALEMSGVRGVCIEYDFNLYMSGFLPEYVTVPRVFHEASHAVTRAVPFDKKLWAAGMAKEARYIGKEALKGDPMSAREELYLKGFLIQYSQIDADEEFAVLAQYLFGSPKELKDLMLKYPEVRKRAVLAIQYFKGLSGKIDLRYFDDVIGEDASKAAPVNGGRG